MTSSVSQVSNPDAVVVTLRLASWFQGSVSVLLRPEADCVSS